MRIAVRTKWQFGPGDGNIPARALMGNPHSGDAWQPAGKTNRTSSRKINSVCRHFILLTIARKGVIFVKREFHPWKEPTNRRKNSAKRRARRV